ncbi:MAG: hypothetical protein RL318_3103 [Fibrobacterota bacterium]|jgi:MATE family multidrug resistance protein
MSNHVRSLLKLCGPLVLSNCAVTAMQIIDAIVLAHHSADSVAAMGPSGMAVVLVQALVFGTVGYASVFCAHAFGAGDAHGIRRGAWRALHLAWMSGILLAVVAWPMGSLFFHLGHAPAVATDEAIYFRILTSTTLFVGIGASLSGWLSGMGRTRILTAIQLSSFAINAGLAWILVLGHAGFPAMGMTGAALATACAQGFTATALGILFWREGGFSDKLARRLDIPGLRRFLALAFPQGGRIALELLAWTAFLFFVGRLGTDPLAASSIAFRINGMAFFPLLGLGQATSILVGQARGAGKDHEVPSIGWQALALGEAWMLIFVILFLSVPAAFTGLFLGDSSPQVAALCQGILVFVACYSIFDAANVVLASALSAAGDTQWTLKLFLGATGSFLAGLFLLDAIGSSLERAWALATCFVFVTSICWLVRFRGGTWRKCQVLAEPDASALEL